MRFGTLIVTILFASSTLVGCGADYDENSKSDQPATTNTDGKVVPISLAENHKPLIKHAPTEDGVIWNYSPLSKQNTNNLKCMLQDGVHTDQFQAIGQSIVYGGILGLIIRVSGRPLLGRWKKEGEPLHPHEPSTPHEDFWAWHWFQKNVKSPFLGVMQGGALGLACQVALSGWAGVSYPGLLGANYESAATSLFLGGMSSAAASPLIRRLFGHAKPDEWAVEKPVEELAEGDEPPANWKNRVQQSLHNSGAGKILRYKIGPALSLIFLGGGVAYLTYNGLQDEPDTSAPSIDECNEVRKIKPKESYNLGIPENPKANR